MNLTVKAVRKSVLNDTSRYIWYWKPSDELCKRSEKQQSVFVFGWGLYWKYDTEKLIDELEILIISGENKKDILKDLEEEHNILICQYMQSCLLL